MPCYGFTDERKVRLERGRVWWVQVKVQFSRIKCRTLHAARAPVPFLKYNSQVRLYSIIGFTHTNTSTISHVSQNEEPSNTHSLSHTHKTSVLRQVITPCVENSPAHVQLGAERGSRHSLICNWAYRFTSCSGPRRKPPMIGALLLEVEWGHLARLGLPVPMTVSTVLMLARRE